MLGPPMPLSATAPPPRDATSLTAGESIGSEMKVPAVIAEADAMPAATRFAEGGVWRFGFVLKSRSLRTQRFIIIIYYGFVLKGRFCAHWDVMVHSAQDFVRYHVCRSSARNCHLVLSGGASGRRFQTCKIA